MIHKFYITTNKQSKTPLQNKANKYFSMEYYGQNNYLMDNMKNYGQDKYFMDKMEYYGQDQYLMENANYNPKSRYRK